WLVLAADMQGEARQYPRLSLRPVDAAVKTKQTSTTEAVVSTPVTPIAPARRPEGAWTITSHMASGVRTVDLGQGAMPFRIGRSRSQALVVDWAHAVVSGRLLELVALVHAVAAVVVHGGDGVCV